MPRRLSYIPLSHDDYVPHAFRPIVRVYRGGTGRMDPAKLELVKAAILRASLPLPQIAQLHGYSEWGLRSAFRRVTGMTITAWRATQVGGSTKPEDGSVADPP